MSKSAVPAYLAQLKQHQTNNISRAKQLLLEYGNVILADEMGLGKTLNTIALFVDCIEHDMLRTGCVFSSPSHVKIWQRELPKYLQMSSVPRAQEDAPEFEPEITSSVNVLRRDGVFVTVVIPSLNRSTVRLADQIDFLTKTLPVVDPNRNEGHAKHGLLVVLSLTAINTKNSEYSADSDDDTKTPEQETLLLKAFRATPMDMCIVDEVHLISENIGRVLAALPNTRFRVGLSGTIIHNTLGKSRKYLEMLDRRFGHPMVKRYLDYIDEYYLRRTTYHKPGDAMATHELSARLETVKRLLHSTMIRNTVAEIARSDPSLRLPPKHEITIYILEDDARRSLYEKITYGKSSSDANNTQYEGPEYTTRLLPISNDADGPKMKLVEKLLYICQLEWRKNLLFTSCAGLLRKSNKVTQNTYEPHVRNTVARANFIDNPEDVLVIASESSDVQRRMEDIEQWAGNDVLDGKPVQTCLACTYETAATGFTALEPETTFKLDPNFLPTNEEQASARNHRQGQTSPVYSFEFVVKRSVEEFVRQRGQQKLRMYHDLGVSVNDRRMAADIELDGAVVAEAQRSAAELKKQLDEASRKYSEVMAVLQDASQPTDPALVHKMGQSMAARDLLQSRYAEALARYERLRNQILDWRSLPLTLGEDETRIGRETRIASLAKFIRNKGRDLGVLYDAFQRAESNEKNRTALYRDDPMRDFGVADLLGHVYDIEHRVYEYGRADADIEVRSFDGWLQDDMDLNTHSEPASL
jgi:hypothetical protein